MVEYIFSEFAELPDARNSVTISTASAVRLDSNFRYSLLAMALITFVCNLLSFRCRPVMFTDEMSFASYSRSRFCLESAVSFYRFQYGFKISVGVSMNIENLYLKFML